MSHAADAPPAETPPPAATDEWAGYPPRTEDDEEFEASMFAGLRSLRPYIERRRKKKP